MGWTSIDADTSWQDLAIAQEIATAYNKRVVAAGIYADAYGLTEITPADTMTVFDFIQTVQDGIEAMARAFADSAGTISGGADYPTGFANAAALFTAAGLTESGGWRRIADAGTQPASWTTYGAAGWSYGGITDKDLAGPWLFIDIEAALLKMTRRIVDYEEYSVVSYYTTLAEGSPAPISPSSPSYTSYEGDLGLDIFAKKLVGAYGLYKQEVKSIHRDFTLSDLSSDSKTIRLLIALNWPDGYDSTGYRYSAFGSTMTPIPTSEGQTIIALAATASGSTAESVTLRDFPEIDAWTDLLDYVPIERNYPYDGWRYFLKNLQNARLVVDYVFDP